MMSTGNWLLIRRIVTTALYNLLRLAFITVQGIYWQLNGTAERLREARLPQNYERSAQVLDVLLFHKFCYSQATTVDNFLCTHNRFENPQYIIDNESITLMTFTEHDAVFCEPEDKEMRLWHGEHGPFIRYAQFDFTRRLVIVPLTTFHRLAQHIGDPQGQIIFLFNISRCGSTLLSQILESTGRCVSVSEPNSPNLIAMKYQKSGETPELRQLAHDVIRWECRPYPTMKPPPLGYCIKFIAPNIAALPLFKGLFPSSKCLFMYRDVVKFAQSFYRLSMAIPTLRLGYLLGRISGHVTRMAADSMGANGANFFVRVEDDMMVGIVVFSVITSIYMEMRGRGFEVSAIRYDDLVAKPVKMCRIILEFCGLPVSLVDEAIKAFEVDSHRNSIVAQSVLERFSAPQLTPNRKARLNELLKKYGMPLIGEPGVIGGTISNS